MLGFNTIVSLLLLVTLLMAALYHPTDTTIQAEMRTNTCVFPLRQQHWKFQITFDLNYRQSGNAEAAEVDPLNERVVSLFRSTINRDLLYPIKL
jgi:hypothetical protein